MTRVLDAIAELHGYPKVIVLDNEQFSVRKTFRSGMDTMFENSASLSGPERRKRFIRRAVVAAMTAGIITVPGQSWASVEPTTCPPEPSTQGSVGFSTVRIRSVAVTSVDYASLIIRGTDVATKKRAVVRLCSGTTVTGRSSSIRAIQQGDVVDAYELTNRAGHHVATKLAVNIFTGIVLITGEAGRSLSLVLMDDHTMKPMTTLAPRSLGLIPTSGTLTTDAHVVRGRQELPASHIPSGSFAKIYGFKTPRSRIVRIYRIELLKHPASTV